MVHDALERLKTDIAFSYHFMAVFVRAARVLAVVDMNRTKTLDAQNPVEFLEHPIKVVDNVISGIVHMAGI